MRTMQIDSYRFLPRSFRPFYENAEPIEGEADPVWAPFELRLADARISLLTSAGLHVHELQQGFDLDRERREPTWGDPTWRRIPATAAAGQLAMSHLHVNPADILVDPNVALPSRRLDELVADGIVGASTESHVSVMGFQESGLLVWRNETAPQIVELLRDERVDGVVLAPV
jgi:D-proline reductase (dithiol) PrdB